MRTPPHVEPHLDAQRFAEQALRLVLEALDRKRPANHLKPVLSPTLLARVSTLSKGSPPGRELGIAILTSVRIQLIDPSNAEVFGRYRRGTQYWAIAGHLTRHRDGWQMDACASIEHMH
jgi:hypothetical protein